MAGAARSARRSAYSSAEEQDLWDAIDGRMRAEMVGTLIHGCPWRIAREVFEVAVADATGRAVPAERDLALVGEPIRVIFGRFDQRGPGRRPDQAA
jgi:hypothetical protein